MTTPGARGKLRVFFAILGMFFAAAVVAAAVGLPKLVEDRFAAAAPYKADCDYILLLPAGKPPSPETLLRAHKAAEEARKNPRAKVVISNHTKPPLEKSPTWEIREELILRGVEAERIILETKATKTAEHAEFIKAARIGDPEKDSYLIVTSPYHMWRSVKVFEKSGFKHIYAAPACHSSSAIGSLDLYYRYRFWGNLQLEVKIIREFVAMAYYKLTGRA